MSRRVASIALLVTVIIAAPIARSQPAQSFANYDLVFPHFASGGGISAELLVTNLSSEPAMVTVSLFGSDGSPASTSSLSASTLTVAPHASSSFRAADAGPLFSGWAYVTSNSSQPIGGILTMTIPGIGTQAVGADGQYSGNAVGYLVPVHKDSSGIDTGIALVFPTYPTASTVGTPATAVLTLRDQNGFTVANGTIQIPINGHVAEYVSQLLPGAWTLLPSFDGTLAITPPPQERADFLVNAFRIGPGEFVTYPVGDILD